MKRKRYTAEFKSQIVLEVLKEEKSMSQIASEHGIHVNQIHKWKTQFLQDMPQIFEKQNKDLEKMKAEHEAQVENLYAEVGKLTTQLSWLKKNLESTMTKKERMELVDWNAGELSISEQVKLLRSSFYYKPVLPSAEEVGVNHRIDEIYTQFPFFGSRRITQLLNQEGVKVNRKRVQRHMGEMDIQAIYPGPNLSKRNLQHRIYPSIERSEYQPPQPSLEY